MKSRQTPYPTDKKLYLLGARDVEAITSVAQEKVHALESQGAVIPNDEYAALQMVLIKLSEENRVPPENELQAEISRSNEKVLKYIKRCEELQEQALERGYAHYCPNSGEWAWKGECDE